MATKPKRTPAPAKPGPGRPRTVTEPGEALVSVGIKIPQSQVDYLSVLGDGYAGRGVRRLIERAMAGGEK